MQEGAQPHDVVDHLAVADGARAAGIVARHAADGAAARGRRLDGEEQAVALEARVQVLQDEARLDGRSLALKIDARQAVQVAAAIEDQPRSDRLPVLGRSPAARDHGHVVLPRD
jgi:hypothetical protein